MNMDMPRSSSAGIPILHLPSASPMSAMSSTFSASTRVTLWFTDWTTTSAATYFLTILFLFCLGMLNRFLGALKSQLERKLKDQDTSSGEAVHATSIEKPADYGIRGHARQWIRALRPQPVRLEEPDGHEFEPLSPATQPVHADEEGVKQRLYESRRFWVANAPWSIKSDGISAVLEFIRALIGYMLYAWPTWYWEEQRWANVET